MMFGTRTRFCAVAVTVLFCALAVFGKTQCYKARFSEVRSKLPNSVLTGTLYYYYDDKSLLKSRLRMDYDLDDDVKVSNIYNYGDGIMYSKCKSGNCSATKITDIADPWFFNSTYYRSSVDSDGYFVRNTYVPEVTVGGKVVVSDKTHRPQIIRIKIKNKDQQQWTNKVEKIDFSDGRNITILDSQLDTTNLQGSTWVQSDSCPSTAKCPVFADLVFVLDNSISVDGDGTKGEWKDQTSFVKTVLNDFDFGENAMAGAIIQFNAPEADPGEYKDFPGLKWYQVGCGIGYDYINCRRCRRDMVWQDPNGNGEYNFTRVPDKRTANFIYAESINEGAAMSVTTNRDHLLTAISRRPADKGHTCQGFGLELAIEVFKNSPRNSRHPNRVVIAVTDGEDECPNRTALMADKLKNEYGVYLIEVGVALNNETACGIDNYNGEFLKGIASMIGGQPAYYSVDKYSQIKSLASQLFKPICDIFHTECGSTCLGFCGCGKCLCPVCEQSHSVCYNYTCRIGPDGKSSNGCEHIDKKCTGGEVVDACHQYKCDDEKGGCYYYKNMCEKEKELYPGDCRKIECDPVSGGCEPFIDNNYCENLFGDGICDIYECTPLDQPVPAGMEKSGCRMKENGTARCQKEFEKDGRSNCFDARCQAGDCIAIDKCSPQEECYTNTCKKDSADNRYKCIKEPITGWAPADVCYEPICKDGRWTRNLTKTDARCKEDFRDAGYDVTCKAYKCFLDTGCRQLPDLVCEPGCGEAGEDDFTDGCISAAAKGASAVYCFAGKCTATKIGDWVDRKCANTTAKNCFIELAHELEIFNSGDNATKQCYTAVCDGGSCNVEALEIPAGYDANMCMHPVCVKQNDGSYKWDYLETIEKASCPDEDKCNKYVCDPNQGCIKDENICESKRNACVNYTCVRDSSGKGIECKEESLLKDSVCTTEYCDEVVEGGKKRKVKAYTVKDMGTACPYPDGSKCYDRECRRNANTGESWCVFERKTDQACEDDPCLACDCDDATGEFDVHPKCVSGDNCTMDSCDINGVCGAEKINCYDLVDMSAFPCFTAHCVSERSEKGYKCMKQLLPNAFIDICGQCISETAANSEESNGEGEFDEGSIKSRDYNAATDCTGAPPKPLLTEGLAAASIALIILAAVVIGAALAASTVMGTKTLIDRAKGANNQSAHTNPLFEETETEMTNPAFIGE